MIRIENRGSLGIPVVTQEKAEIESVNINMNQNIIEHTTSENLRKLPELLESQNKDC